MAKIDSSPEGRGQTPKIPLPHQWNSVELVMPTLLLKDAVPIQTASREVHLEFELGIETIRLTKEKNPSLQTLQKQQEYLQKLLGQFNWTAPGWKYSFYGEGELAVSKVMEIAGTIRSEMLQSAADKLRIKFGLETKVNPEGNCIVTGGISSESQRRIMTVLKTVFGEIAITEADKQQDLSYN